MSKTLIRRVTAMTAAFVSACDEAGIDTSKVSRLPQKTEPSWTVTRRARRK